MGILTGGTEAEPTPLDRFALWSGTIPGQAAGSVVQFTFVVADLEGADARNPDDLCPGDTGPCNRIGYPGDGCQKDEDDPEGLRFEGCDVPYRYKVAHEPSDELASVVINEVVASQSSILEDTTDGACGRDNPNCKFDDYIELYNGADEAVDLSGVWVSDKPFNPQEWKFPDGSMIEAGGYLIVWCDGDGGTCPRPDEVVEGDGQDCVNAPTDAAAGEFHTSFRLSGASGEQVYLFDRKESDYGLIHGYRFGPQESDVAESLCPNGDPNGTFGAEMGGSPRAENECSAPRFLRGDTDGNCSVNLSDAVFVLQHLFAGGIEPACLDAADTDDDSTIGITDPISLLGHLFQGQAAPPAPGATCPGFDPTEDQLGCSVAPECNVCP